MKGRSSYGSVRPERSPRDTATAWGGRTALCLSALALAAALALLSAVPAADARLLLDDGEEAWVAAPQEDREGAVGAAPLDYWEGLARRIDEEIIPVPKEPQAPLSVLRATGSWGSFRTPFPAVPVWNPPGPKKVGLQAGHWLYDESPDELEDLRSNPGTSGGGKAEWQVTLDIAQRAADMLRAAGVEVDVLPTTVPVRYRAHAFVSIHADGDASGVLHGFKAAGPGFSATPRADALLVDALNEEYAAATGLPRQDSQISRRMTYYYAFNGRRYQHAVAPGVPQVILETAFLTHAGDRVLLLSNPDLIASGIANGILKFLAQNPTAVFGQEDEG